MISYGSDSFSIFFLFIGARVLVDFEFRSIEGHQTLNKLFFLKEGIKNAMPWAVVKINSNELDLCNVYIATQIETGEETRQSH